MGKNKNDQDVRDWLHPEDETPEWFWDIVTSGQQDRELFKELCRDLPQQRFAEFIQEYRDLANAFLEAPFASSSKASSGDHRLDTGRWVISQGKDFFLKVWHHPEEFWLLLEQNVVKKRKGKKKQESYGYLPEEIWLERFGEDFRPL